MAANVRFRSTYYNTTGNSVTYTLEILDTEPVSQIINFECTRPDEGFEGLTQDLKPGVYPSTLKFGMFLRSTPKVVDGVTMGPSTSIITDIFTAAEGRFLARLKKDGIIHFVGPIIYDQCDYTDEDIPLLSITAVDGMTRWNTEDYVSQVGGIVYYSMRETQDDNWATAITPLTIDLADDAEWIVIQHSVFGDEENGLFYVETVFARRETYAKNSPGTGWVSVGGGKWVKELDYTNETTTNDPDVYYLLTRNIDDQKQRPINLIISKAIEKTNMTGEYIAPAVMYDCSSEWYETSMSNFTSDPFTMIRIHEEQLLGGSWMDAMQELCRLFNLRVYYSKGRYHFEQISMRDDVSIKRFTYQADGTAVGTETVNLDLNFNTLGVQPGTGGLFKILPPFKSVEAFISLDISNLLDGIVWADGKMGQKYLGRVQNKTGNQHLLTVLKYAFTSTFDPSVLSILDPGLVNSLCKHVIRLYFKIRITNIATGTTYYLTPDPNSNMSTWETTEVNIERSLLFGTGSTTYSADNYGYTIDNGITIRAEDLPAPEGAMFDVFMSVNYSIEWDNTAAASLWEVNNPTKHWHTFSQQSASMRVYSDLDPLTEASDSIAQNKTVFVENDVDNSIKVKLEVKWADTNQPTKAVQIYDGTNWINSSEWAINGVGTTYSLLELLVKEIMSFRTLPRRLYSGSFLTSLPNAESRFQRESYYYLPLSCTKDTDVDTFQGEFLEIARTTPSDPDTITDPIAGGPTDGFTFQDNPSNDQPTDELPQVIETDEAISGGPTLTELDIVNTIGWSVAAGNVVQILNVATGESESVTLTQSITPSSTVMYFTSYTFLNDYPDASPIILNPIEPPSPTGYNRYRYSDRDYTGQYHVVSQFNFAALNGMNINTIDAKVKIWRNGALMTCVQGLTVDPHPAYWTYGVDDDRFEFSIPLAGEALKIEADLTA